MAAATPPEPVCRTAELRAIEAAAANDGLMERAGLAAAEVARAMGGERGGAVLVLAGPGNNGGDAFVVARWLRQWFYDVTVVFRADAARLPADAATALAAFRAAGGTTADAIPSTWRGTLIVDGLFGIGLARAPSADYAAMIEWVNASRTPVLALDVPSGLDAETGCAFAPAIHATATATFIALKPGLLTGDGVDRCGRISVHSLGLSAEVDAAARGHRLEWLSVSKALPDVLRRRVRNVHKGTFGTLGIVGGARGMIGAPLLAGRAALNTGAGKVWTGFAAAEFPAVDWTTPELMLRTADQVLGAGADALACGTGLGTDAVAKSLVARAVAEAVPLVLDADALNLIASDKSLAQAVARRTAPTIVTPHPAEAARLLGMTVDEVQADRLGAAQALSDTLHASVVVKGAGSVLAHPDGTWDINASGNPGLASAGSGDVLTGFVAALLAQRIDAATALRIGVCLHGAAADACVAAGAGPLGLTASELIPAARTLLNDAVR